LVTLLAILLAPVRLTAQSDVQREQLLNGLKILFIPRPGDPSVLLKLRIHSGSAFDTAGKSGTMALLADLLFPDPLTFEYFKDEIDGRLLVETTQDAIDITMQGRATEYDRIVDILRGALITTPLSPENVSKIRDAKIKVLSERKPSAAELANQTVAVRLFGAFPYAKGPAGTPETLRQIDRADLLLAKDRFLSPNNATLVIIGGVDHAKAMRALRQLLGGWRKSEELVPATFRQPAPPDARVLLANFPEAQATEVRLALRGLARGDRDYLAATLLSFIARDRWQKLMPEAKVFVRHEAHTLPGLFIMGSSVDSSNASAALDAARATLKSLVDAPISAPELEKAKSEYLANENKVSGNDRLATDWLNIEAYSLPLSGMQMRNWSLLSTAELQRVAARLFLSANQATVIVGHVESLKAKMTSANIEILGETKTATTGIQPTQPTSSPTPTPAPTKRRTFVFTPKATSPLIKNQKPTPTPD
jgi:zinc protease